MKYALFFIIVISCALVVTSSQELKLKNNNGDAQAFTTSFKVIHEKQMEIEQQMFLNDMRIEIANNLDTYGRPLCAAGVGAFIVRGEYARAVVCGGLFFGFKLLKDTNSEINDKNKLLLTEKSQLCNEIMQLSNSSVSLNRE